MPTHRRHAVRIAAVGILLLCIGCFGGVSNPGYFPWFEPHEDVIRTHARPTGEGYFANFDREAYKLEATPVDITLPVRSQQVVVATVFDESGKPRRKRRVDWQLDGVGAIVEVDESGYLPGRGGKVDGKYAWSHTDYSEHPLPPGLRDASGVTIGAGQTWLAVTSALEGTTSVMVFAPEISDKERNRVYVRIHWVDAKCTFPTAATARAGTEYALATSVFHATDQQPASGYRVRYRIVDGPKAAMTASAIAPTTELTVPTDGNGLAKVSIKETEAKFGANRVQIEILKPDAERIGGFLVVDRQEVMVSWDAPQVHLDVQSAKTTQINQEFPVTYSVASTGTVATDPLIVNVTIPPGMELVRTEPKATQDPQKGVLIWNLDPIGPGKQQTIQAVYRPASVGSFSLAARVRTEKPDDPSNTQGTAQVQVVETKLSTTIDGPRTAFVGEKIPYQITVSNPGTGMAENVKVSLVFDNGLALADGTVAFEKVIESLPPGGSQTIDADLTPKQAGRSMLHSQAASGSLLAQSPPAAVDVKQPQLKVDAFGPTQGYLNQEVTWTVRVFNPGDVPLSNVALNAVLPAEATFRTASNGGKASGGSVAWLIPALAAKQHVDVQVTGMIMKRADKATLVATAGADPVPDGGSGARTVSMVKPVGSDQRAESTVAFIGVPALQMETSDSADPVLVGQQLTYTIRVKNAGTVDATQIDLTADLPAQVKVLKTGGPTKGRITGQKVVFAQLDALQPGSQAVYTIVCQAMQEGTGKLHAELQSLSLRVPLTGEEATRIQLSGIGPTTPAGTPRAP